MYKFDCAANLPIVVAKMWADSATFVMQVTQTFCK